MFPSLKTKAVAQYPTRRTTTFSTQIVRFLDGREQRYRDCPGPLKRWEIRLEQLDEAEVGLIEQFFVENQGSFGEFRFIDPLDGREYPKCSVDADSFDWTARGEMNVSTRLVIRENRG